MDLKIIADMINTVNTVMNTQEDMKNVINNSPLQGSDTKTINSAILLGNILRGSVNGTIDTDQLVGSLITWISESQKKMKELGVTDLDEMTRTTDEKVSHNNQKSTNPLDELD